METVQLTLTHTELGVLYVALSSQILSCEDSITTDDNLKPHEVEVLGYIKESSEKLIDEIILLIEPEVLEKAKNSKP